jgi:hypothetical protein
MSDGIAEIVDLPDEFQNTPFERIVILALKEICSTIRNLEDRIEVLEQGGK